MIKKPLNILTPKHALKSFQHLGHTYSVDHDRTPQVGGKETMGTYSPIELAIVIHPLVEGTRRQEVECHEVAEAWNAELGLELEHGKIQAIGAALQQFLLTAKYVKTEE